MTTPSTMRYLRPAETWTEALPIGNGRLGAMVFGSPVGDLLRLNEETLWGASVADPNNPSAADALDEVRAAIFEGRLSDAQELAGAKMLGTPPHFPPYEPLGDLRISGIKPVDYSDYSRELDLGTGIASSHFLLDGVGQHREYFVSAVDQVIAVRYKTDGAFPKLRFDLDSPRPVRVRVAGSPPPMPGQAGDSADLISAGPGSDPKDHILLMSGVIEGGGVAFTMGVSVRVENATTVVTHHWDERAPQVLYSLGGGDTLTVFIAAETTFGGASEPETTDRVIQRLVAAEQRGFDRVRADHVENYRELRERFTLSLHDESERVEPAVVVPDLIREARDGAEDTRRLTEVFVEYCRHILISSSRPGGLPSTLQGVWNAERWPNWESDFHPNVNLQLNYWAADGLALPETVDPLGDWVSTLETPGRATARKTYRSGGWTLNHLSNAWGYTAPGAGAFGVWPMGAAWMCMNLYDHYLHTQDLAYLRERVYPLMRGASEFFLDYLIEAPASTTHAGRLVTAPSTSPENTFVTKDGGEAYMTYGSTMDMAIIEDLFRGTLEALHVLRRDDSAFDTDFGEKIRDARSRLLPTLVSPTTHGVQEWAEDYTEVDPGHRHVSALYGVFPGRSISAEATPELAAAALTTIHRKFASHYQAEGWSLGWIAIILARLGESDEALHTMTRILREMLFPNLFVEAHMYPQVGDMQGVPAAVLQMLAFSDPNEVVILPALPSRWTNGHVTGMRLRGNRTLSATWRDGRLADASIEHDEDDEFDLRVGVPGEYVIARHARITTVSAQDPSGA